MTSEIIARNMRKALNRFAQWEQTGANSIQLFIHTKNNEWLPEYFYAVNGQPKTEMVDTEEGEKQRVKSLRFTQDILGLPIDIVGAEPTTQLFLKNYFQAVCEEEKIEQEQAYVMITAEDEKAKQLTLALYNGTKAIKQIQLSDLFGD